MRNKAKDRERDRKKFEEVYKPAYDAWIAHYPFTLDNLPGEIWLPVPDFEELYHCSNWGRIKSFQLGKEIILKPSLLKGGYLRVVFRNKGNEKKVSVHRLVAELFIPNQDNLPEVDHVYGMKFDCSVWNLRWATSSENQKYAIENGLRKSIQGEDSANAKFTNEQVRYIRNNPDGLTVRQLAEKFSVVDVTISEIQRGIKYKNAGGTIRGLKRFARIPDDMREKILAAYQPGVRGHGMDSLAKRFGFSGSTIWNIVHGVS